jgi:hypothetical protein
MALLQELTPAFAIVTRMEERLMELEHPDCTSKKVLECLAKLYYYAGDLEPHYHWWQVKRASNILIKGFKRLTEGTRMGDRLCLAKYEMQGTKSDLIIVYKKFIREMKRFDFRLADELM